MKQGSVSNCVASLYVSQQHHRVSSLCVLPAAAADQDRERKRERRITNHYLPSVTGLLKQRKSKKVPLNIL